MASAKRKSGAAGQVGIGVIGLGHWGPNYLRTFRQLADARVVFASDSDGSRLEALSSLYPEVEFTGDYREVLRSGEVDAVVVATPGKTHREIAGAALESGKDVLCEKPLAVSSAECRELNSLAGRKKRVLMVGHIFMYNAGIQKIKQYIESEKMGKVYYMTSMRTNPGPVREDVNVVYDLATHDVSIFNYLMGGPPKKASAQAASFLKPGREDIGFITLHYPGGTLGHVHVSWLTPRKQREIMVVGSHRMIIWDDLNPLEPVRVHSRGSLEEPFYSDFGSFVRMARASDVHMPKISAEEPMVLQNGHFIECVRSRQKPLSDGNNGLEVVRTLEMVQKALARGK